VSGDTGSVSYDLSSFLFDTFLSDFEIVASSDPSLTIGWATLDFIVQFNYHICADSWPHPCENGWIIVYTTNTVQVQTALSLDFSGSAVALSASSANLIFNDGDIDVFVQCTDTICLLPVPISFFFFFLFSISFIL
jgi:hypothetical protein